MDDRALIQEQTNASHGIIKHCLADISDEEACRIPNAALSPIIWQVGHLALVNLAFIKRAGIVTAASVPESYGGLFATGTGGKADYPALESVVKTMDDTHDALIRAVGEANLDAVNEGPRGLWNNVAGMFAFSTTHRWYHIGKITTLRALLGKPRLFG